MHRIILIVIALVLLFGGSDAVRLVDNQNTASIPEIRSSLPGYCLDDHHDGKGINAVVDLWTCNGSPAQNWVMTGSKIEHDSDFCLGVLNNGKSAGDPVVLNACSKAASQKWAVDLGGYENTASGLCLSTPYAKIGTQLTLDSCNNLSRQSDSWSADTWSDNDGNYNNCNSIADKGDRVACYAEYQWQTWEAEPSLHEAMLNNYTDGNTYEEWCADFVSYVYLEAGVPFDQGERGNGNWDEYDANNVQNQGFTLHQAGTYTPQPGDVAFFDYPGGHVEIVVKGGSDPTFVYGDSGTVDPKTNNGDMNEDMLTNDGSAGQVTYYMSPN